MGALGYEAETTGGRRPPRRTAVLAALLAVSSIAPIALAVSAAPAGAATGKVAVRAIGTAPYVPNGARVLGAVPATTRIRFDVVLRPRDPASLQAFVNAVSTPGSPEYRHYLAPGRFGHVFGPRPGTITALRAWLRSTGLDPGPTTVDGLTVPVVATAASTEGALGLHLNRYKLASGRTAFANTTAPRLPAALTGAIATVLGLDNLHLSHSLGVQNASRNAVHGTPAGAAPTGQRQTISPRAVASPCTAAATAASNSGSYTANQVAKAYSMTSLENAGTTGKGVTLALYELEPYLASDAAAYQACYGTNVPITNVNVDGGPGPVTSSNGREATLDIDQVLGLSPGVSLAVYQGPNGATGPYDVTQAIVTGCSFPAGATGTCDTSAAKPASVVSTSWGECEADLGLAGAQAEQTLFQEAAAEGQSWFAAAGDQGSEDCVNSNSGDTSLAVDDPGSQLNVTSVGGTSLASAGPPPTESVWNNGPCNPSNCTSGAGGGGISTFWQMPSWQQALGVYADSSGTPCGAATGSYCREVPDVSADADPNTGYVVYFKGNWSGGNGGTSAAAPLWASVTALLDQSCTAPLGFINPSLYAAVQKDPGIVDDVTSGNNDLTATNGGKFTARVGFDMASGLGTPVASALATTIGCATAPPPPTPEPYHPVAPYRVADTRAGSSEPYAGQTLGTGATLNIQVGGTGSGSDGVPAGATAVVLNVTAVQPSVGGYLTVYPTGVTRPLASNLNFQAGENTPNLVEVGLGTSGQVSVYNASGNTDVIVDVEGYTGAATAQGAGLYNPLAPARIEDTRPGSGQPGAGQTLSGGGTLDVQATGAGGVPSTGVAAVVLNVTVTNTASSGYLSVYPTGTTPPTASNLNWTQGTTRPNRVIVPVGTGGKVTIYNSAGTTDVIVDVGGWFTDSSNPSATGDQFTSVTPARICDTRSTQANNQCTGQTLAPGSSLAVTVQGTGGLPSTGVAAVVLNVTATNTSSNGYLTVYPSSPRPTASDLNWAQGETVPNLVVVQVSAQGTIEVYNSAGSTDLIVDVVGWYG